MTRIFDTPLITTDQSIDRVLNAGLAVLLIFSNGQLTSALDQALKKLARQEAGQLLVVQINLNDNPETARRYQVTRTPSLVAIRDGQALAKAEAINPADLSNYAAYLLGKGPKPAPSHPETYHASGGIHQASPQNQPRPTDIGHPRVVTDATFDNEVMRSNQPVLVDFWAPWCGPCRMIEPITEKLAHELAGRLRVAKVNVDENPAISQRYGIRSIPTMLVVKDGRIVDQWVGALPESAIRSRIRPVI